MKQLPTVRITALGALVAAVVFACVWAAAAEQPTAARICLGLLGAAGGLIFGGLLGLITWDQGEEEATPDRSPDHPLGL